MADLDELVEAGRVLARGVVRDATKRLTAGRDIRSVQEEFVRPALALLEELEARSILAASGDATALRSVEQLVEELSELRSRLGELEG